MVRFGVGDVDPFNLEGSEPSTVLIIRVGAFGRSRSKPEERLRESGRLSLVPIRDGKYVRTNGRSGGIDVDMMARSTSTAVHSQML